jgi:hypothetical protein
MPVTAPVELASFALNPPEKIVTPRAAGVVAEPAYLSITAVL